jgi:hypothetical protein
MSAAEISTGHDDVITLDIAAEICCFIACFIACFTTDTYIAWCLSPKLSK